MSLPELMSPIASRMARSCAPVGEKGREPVKVPSPAPRRTRPCAPSRPPRRSPSAQASTNNSSNTSLRRARLSACMSAGKWTFS